MMSIQPLPKTSSVQLSSGQVLLGPTSVIKELVDNAIDAKSKSICIEISADTLDSIQVRDNGQGINPDDRSLVGQRFCTSKIKSLQDLSELGGSSLGFRGEALNSLISLAEKVEVTTRIDGETTAVKMRLTKNPTLYPRETVSHPVGTTVKASNLFNNLPVRKQNAVKEASKTIGKIQKLLHAYVLAKPDIRLSFKVLNGKGRNQDFIYAPKVGASSTKDAAMKLFGRDCVNESSYIAQEVEGYGLQAIVPMTGHNPSKATCHGQFVALDSRPVSHSRGTLKQIYTIFKSKLKAHDVNFVNIKDPLFVLNIICPPQTYDINVEPAKDDVLFLDREKVIAAAGLFFNSIYPLNKTANLEEIRQNELAITIRTGLETPTINPAYIYHSDGTIWGSSDTIQHDESSNTGLRGKVQHLVPKDYNPQQSLFPRMPTPDTQINMSSSIPGTTMYGYEDDDLTVTDSKLQEQVREHFEELREAANDVEASNPWVFAKMVDQTRASQRLRQLAVSESKSNSNPEQHLALPPQLVHGVEIPPIRYSPSIIAHNSSVPTIQSPRKSMNSSISGQMTNLMNRFHSPVSANGARRYDLRSNEHRAVLDDSQPSNDIRTYFEGRVSQHPRKQSGSNNRQKTDSIDALHSSRQNNSRKPRRKMHNQAQHLTQQWDNGDTDQAFATNHALETALADNLAELPAAERTNNENFVTQDIVNFFRNSQATTLPKQQGNLMIADPRPAQALPFSGALPMDAINPDARTHDLIYATKTSITSVVQLANANEPPLEPWLMPFSLSPPSMPSITDIMAASSNEHELWASLLRGLLLKTQSEVLPPDSLEAVLLAGLLRCVSLAEHDL